MTTKLDLTKEYKTYYKSKTSPEVVEFAEIPFLTIEGKGEPGGKEFTSKVEALYPLAYGVKNICKKQGKDFGVPKLEGLWWVESDRPALEVPCEEWRWKLLIRMPDNPETVTEEQMEGWVKDFDYWEICDQCCQNLFIKTDFAYQKAVDWSGRNEEFIKRAGFALMAWLAFKDKKAKDEQFETFFPSLKREATDNRNFVKKAVNWALRQIGKRNIGLNMKAIETAKEIQKIESKSAKWIAQDAIKELTSDAIQERLKKGGK
jgi:3-methyladenine DNA glycosylase AlkD